MAQQEPTAPFVGTEQNLVFALTEIWDVGTLAWVKNEGGAAGGGAATIADGADVAQGSKADVAWVAGDGTVIALLKAIAGASGVPGLTDAELRATPVPVSGTVAVTGPLTDAQLRAVAVPISGTVTANTGLSQPLTDTELRATPVPVSGTVAVTGALTDAQLRATPVPVDGPLTDAELRATPVPVSGTVVANPTGYITRLDEASATITYVGSAVPGTATSAASWSIKRLDSTSGLVVLYAAGSAAFNQIWDNRAALAYS